MAAALAATRARTRDLPTWLTGPLVPAVTAAVLGLIGIGDKSFWQDEAFSAAVARLPTVDLMAYLFHEEMHASPYYMLLNVWTALGTTEAVMRFLSVIIGVVGVVATYYVATRYKVAFLASLLLAVSPLFVQFEQNVREYTLLVAWASISTLAYLRYIETPTRRRAVVYVLAAALLIYVHPIGAFLIGAHAIWEFSRGPAANRIRRLAIFVPIAIAWIPMLRFMVVHRDKIAWIQPLSVDTISEASIAVAGGLIALIVLVVLVAIRLKRDLITLWLVVPVAGTLLVSAFIQPMLQARYLIVVLPAIAIILARNRRIAVLVIVVLWSIGVAGWYISKPTEDWRGAQAWIAQASEPGDGAVFWPSYSRLPVEYYGAVDESLYPPMSWADSALPGRVPQGRLPAAFDNPRIWLVDRNGPELSPDVATALAGYSATETRSFGPNNFSVTLLVRDPSQ